MKRLNFEIVAVVAGFLMILSYQNCGGEFAYYQSSGSGVNDLAVYGPLFDFDFVSGGQSSAPTQLVYDRDYDVTYLGPEDAANQYSFAVNAGNPANCRFTPTTNPKVQKFRCSFLGPAKTTVSVVWPDGRSRSVEKAIMVLSATATPTPTAGTATPTPIPTGASLYQTNCQLCHGALATSTKRGRTAAQIRTAIMNVNAMMNLGGLTDAELQLIAVALQ